MGKPFDYNPIALNYSKTRSAKSWVLKPLIDHLKKLPVNSDILEIGCGTGNYIISLSESLPNHNYYGFDISDEMLRIAKSRSDKINFIKADAETSFPFDTSLIDFSFAVDVIHHIVNTQNFFDEISRCLKNDGKFMLVTDLENNIKSRSLSKFFPEILDVELNRYPSLQLMEECAVKTGLDLIEIASAENYEEINDEFIYKVKRKCSSSMRLISDEAHKKGIERLITAKEKNEKWFSTYSVLIFEK